MSAECSFATATVRAKEFLDVTRGDDIGIAVDFVILVSFLKAVLSATGTSEDFVGISSPWLNFPTPMTYDSHPIPSHSPKEPPNHLTKPRIGPSGTKMY